MSKRRDRVVGLDVHPDSFAGAVLEGSDPASAKVLSTSTRVASPELESWALQHTLAGDTLVLEASGNAFAVGERLRALSAKWKSWTVTERAKWGRSTAPMIGSMRSSLRAST